MSKTGGIAYTNIKIRVGIGAWDKIGIASVFIWQENVEYPNKTLRKKPQWVLRQPRGTYIHSSITLTEYGH